MKVSREFLKDFAYIANLYGWDAADIDDAKAQTRAAPGPMLAYWTMLAAAHRAGYRQDSANGFIRLSAWGSIPNSKGGHGPEIKHLEAIRSGANMATCHQGSYVPATDADYYQSSDSCPGRRGGANE